MTYRGTKVLNLNSSVRQSKPSKTNSQARHPATMHLACPTSNTKVRLHATWDALPCSATAMLRGEDPPPSEATDSHVITSCGADQSQDAEQLISKPLVFVLATHAAAPRPFRNSALANQSAVEIGYCIAASYEPRRPAPALWQLS